MLEFIAVIVFVLTLLLLVIVIKKAIDDSKATAKLDELIQEIRLLRKEIKDNKHIIDKRM